MAIASELRREDVNHAHRDLKKFPLHLHVDINFETTLKATKNVRIIIQYSTK